MKKLLLIFIALTFYNIFSQNHFVFTELRGLEGNSGNTHLFYRTGTIKSITNSIYHFNVKENSDTLFLLAYYYGFPFGYYVGISDFDFFNSDPQKFIFCGSAEWPDAIGYISLYNKRINLYCSIIIFNCFFVTY